MRPLAAAVNAVKHRIGAQRVVLVGHSVGAKVVRDAYLESPDSVAGVVLIDGRFYDGDKVTLTERARKAIDEVGFIAFSRARFRTMFTERSDAAVKERIVGRLDKMNPSFGRELFIDAVLWDPDRGLETLRQLAVPVLLLQSTDVWPDMKQTPIQSGIQSPFVKAVASTVPDSEIRIVADAGHFTMIEAAEAVSREIAKFTERVASPRAPGRTVLAAKTEWIKT
jgi:pimeloyl-ACP methyl ester carboxylesterase